MNRNAVADALETILTTLDEASNLEDSQMVHVLNAGAATASVTISGVTYSLTLNRED